jgi:tetratricopeptide (TPR) repeat protein
MWTTRLWLLLVVLSGTRLVAAEEPAYRRVLKDDDGKKAAALENRVKELCTEGKFAEAIAPADELRKLRQQMQGEGHWEAADAAQLVETLRQAARLPAAKQQTLATCVVLIFKAQELSSQGKYAQTEPMYRKVLAGWEELLGPKHPNTATSYNNLASILGVQGRATEGEALCRKALAIREEVLGAKHPDTAQCYHILGHLLQDQGRAREAEPLYRKALAIREEVLGPKHQHTAQSYNSLGVNLDDQGRAREAEPLYRKALAIREEVLGPKHPDAAATYNNLAINLNKQGRAREAEPLYRKALAIREQVLGPKHPYTAQSYMSLGFYLQTQGRAAEAELLYRKALDIREEVLGPKHPDTARSYNHLAYDLNAQGRAWEAEPLFCKALAIRQEVLGPRHPDTPESYHNLAYNLDAEGRAREAEPLIRKALALYEEVLGHKHPETANCYGTLAVNLQVQGRAGEAEPLYRKALAIYEEVGGPKHLDTARTCNNLATNLVAQGRAREAEPLCRKALAIREEVLGPKHPYTASTYNNLGHNLQAQGRAREAKPLYRKALAIDEEVLGHKHPDTATTYNNLALNLQAQGRATQAEPLWRAAVAATEVARLRLASTALDRAAAVRVQPHLGLAACLARLDRAADAWDAVEVGLARGLLDDLAARAALPGNLQEEARDRQRAARLDALDRLLAPLLTPEQLTKEQRRNRDELLGERTALDEEAAGVAATRSRQAVRPLAAVQAALAPDAALVVWVDLPETVDHWGCVLRRSGPPAWVKLRGSGPQRAWSQDDDKLPQRLRDRLTHGEPDVGRYAGRLAQQRLEPLVPHLAASAELPEVRHLVVVPVGVMAGIPVEVFSDRYLVSYAPSGSVLARLAQKHRPLAAPTLLALGNPNFDLPSAGPPPQPPQNGLYLSVVLPGGNAARAGLRGGDVLLRYGGKQITTRADLKIAQGGAAVPVVAWRDGRVLDELRVADGKLGVVVSEDPPAVALQKRRELDLLADARVRSGLQPLPGTRLEVAALVSLLPQDKTTLLLGSHASEQELQALSANGKLKTFRLLHLATHGQVDPVAAGHSALLLARDCLPDVQEQARLIAAGKKVPTGRLTVEDIANNWELDADLVSLSACQTALGPQGGGEGLLGFSQVLLGKGARSLLLSLWKVDDTGTALLMQRFYQNLLGKREGLKAPLPRAESLQEAKRWLRELSRVEVEKLAGELAQGAVRADEEDPKGQSPPRVARKPVVPNGDKPFAHPFYWAAFILIGDPE